MRRRSEASKRLLTTVLFTDIAGSTQRAAELGDKRWRHILAAHHRLVRSQLKRHGGREIDTAGDGFLATFDQPAQAIACAEGIVADVRRLGIEVRAGVHVGEVEVIGPKVGGIAVHIGARVMSKAGPGQVVVSNTVRDLMSGSDLTFTDLGYHELKGVPGQWHLYAVEPAGMASPEESPLVAQEESSRRRLPWTVALVVAGVVAVLVIPPIFLIGGRIGAGRPSGPPGVGPDYLARMDPATRRTVARIPVGEHPIDVAVGEGSVWVLDRDGSVRRIDPVSNRAAVIRKVAEDPRAITAGEGWIWVADGTKEVVHRIDPASNRLASSIQLGAVAHDVAADSNGVWAAAGSGIVRIDPSSGDVVALQGTVGGEAGGLAPKARYKTGVGGGFVWQISQLFPKIARFDVADDRFDVIDIDVAPRVIAVSRTDVWLATCGAPGMVIRLDARAGEVTATVAAGGSTCSDLVTGRPIAISADDAGAWVTDGVNGTVSRINATTNQVDLPTRVGDTPTAVAVGLGSVWVTVDGTSG